MKKVVDAGSIKIVRTYRLSHEAAELLRVAAEEIEVSQGDVIENCIIDAIEGVRARLAAEQKEKARKRAERLASLQLTKRSRGRPRKDSIPLPPDQKLKDRQKS